jgi:hypothetical protein
VCELASSHSAHYQNPFASVIREVKIQVEVGNPWNLANKLGIRILVGKNEFLVHFFELKGIHGHPTVTCR